MQQLGGEVPYQLYAGVYGDGGANEIGVYGTAGGNGYAGRFEGRVEILGQLDVTGNRLKVEGNQGYALITSSSSANGSVLELRNETFAAPYLGAINFSTSSSTPGQISYQSDNALHFRTGSVDDRMKLNATGLYVNGTFVSSSDRNVKENFQPVDARQVLDKVLALPLTRWNYKADATDRKSVV